MSGEIVIRRVFAAPRERVWDAWTDPDQIVRWWGKRGWNIDPATLEMEVRPGGPFRHVSIEEGTGATMAHDGWFTAVEPPARLAFASATATGEVTFTALDANRTEMVFRTVTDLPGEVRTRAVAGMGSAFDRLAELVIHDPEEEHTWESPAPTS